LGEGGRSSESTYFVDVVGVDLRVDESVDAVEECHQLHRFTVRRDVHEVGNVAEIYRRALRARSAAHTAQELATLNENCTTVTRCLHDAICRATDRRDDRTV